MDGQSGHYDLFRTPYFSINISAEIGCKNAQRRRSLLWSVIQSICSMQNSPKPSSSTSLSLTPTGGESSSSLPSPRSVVESLESTIGNTSKKTYSGTPLYGHLLDTHTCIQRTVSFVPTFSLKNNTVNTDNGHFLVSRVTNFHISSTQLTDSAFLRTTYN